MVRTRRVSVPNINYVVLSLHVTLATSLGGPNDLHKGCEAKRTHGQGCHVGET